MILGHPTPPFKTVALAVTPPQKAKKNVLNNQDIIFQMVRAALQLSDSNHRGFEREIEKDIDLNF